jgi:hypothetical protein
LQQAMQYRQAIVILATAEAGTGSMNSERGPQEICGLEGTGQQ